MTKVIGATEDGPFRQLEWAVAQYEPIGFNPGLTSQFILNKAAALDAGFIDIADGVPSFGQRVA